ncbi:hypothetical protein DICVIV_12633 [Dictyocaulus viviparus]|uniref:Reverse transcriptase domain-containing protein n=1 Tax=Dictyocaulus viviparus TaxID=29172 RepID=A0A0D8X9Z7_DICVI|nr:hypothetical protein DICVIV_12633 [Dictyocaulus viviparus]
MEKIIYKFHSDSLAFVYLHFWANLPPVLIKTLARLFKRYLSECKTPNQLKTSSTDTFKSIMRKLDSDDTGVKIDASQHHHLRCSDDIVFIGPHTSKRDIVLIQQFFLPKHLRQIPGHY